jgi:hypothetical protein
MTEIAALAGWRAFAWLGALNLTGALITLEAVRSICIYCEGSTGDPTPGLLLGFATLAAAPIIAARSCGRRLWFLAGLGAGVAAVVGFAAGADLFDQLYPAIVLGLAVEGAFAVRLPVPEAVVSRAAVVGALGVLCAAATFASSDVGLLVLVFVTLPALALTDTIVAWLARRAAAATVGS